jgi:hypothetical protein
MDSLEAGWELELGVVMNKQEVFAYCSLVNWHFSMLLFSWVLHIVFF